MKTTSYYGSTAPKKIETDVHIFGDRHEMILVSGQYYYSRVNISYALSHI